MRPRASLVAFFVCVFAAACLGAGQSSEEAYKNGLESFRL